MVDKHHRPLKTMNFHATHYAILILKENVLMMTSRFELTAHSNIHAQLAMQLVIFLGLRPISVER